MNWLFHFVATHLPIDSIKLNEMFQFRFPPVQFYEASIHNSGIPLGIGFHDLASKVVKPFHPPILSP